MANTGGAFNIEWDGITQILQITGLLDMNLAEHTIKIGLADTSDTVFDSAVYLAALSGGTTDGGGGIGDPDDDTPVIPIPASMPLLIGGLGALGLMRRRKSRS